MGTVRCSNHLGVCVCLPLVRGGVCLWSRGVSAFGLRGCLALVRGREGVWLWSQGSVCLRSQGSVHPLGRHLPGRHLLGCTPHPVYAGIHPPTQCILGYTPNLPSACWDTSHPGQNARRLWKHYLFTTELLLGTVITQQMPTEGSSAFWL